MSARRGARARDLRGAPPRVRAAAACPSSCRSHESIAATLKAHRPESARDLAVAPVRLDSAQLAVERQNLAAAEPRLVAEQLGQVSDPPPDLAVPERLAQQPSRPAVGEVRPTRSFTAVVLPAPFGPRKPKTSPRWTVIDSPASATMAPYRFTRSCVSITDPRWGAAPAACDSPAVGSAATARGSSASPWGRTLTGPPGAPRSSRSPGPRRCTWPRARDDPRVGGAHGRASSRAAPRSCRAGGRARWRRRSR